jgi:hypothetical protein
MYALTPTKDNGATAKSNDVVYVEPAQTVTDADLAAQLDVDGMNSAFIADFLSACLTHERCGTHLYRSVAGRTANPTLQAQYERFGEQTILHVEILEDLIVATGGNPAYVSPLARAVETADSKALEATFLGSGGIDVMSAEMAMLDAVFMAETVDQANWEVLGQLADALPVGPMKRQLTEAVAIVEEHEDEHLEWSRTTRSRLTMLQASSSMLTGAAAKGEELVAQVKGWFSGEADLGRSEAARPPKKAPTAKKSATKKSAAKKSAAKKSAAPAKKAATKKKAASKKSAPAKKAAAKKTASKKSAKKKAAPAKKAATKKSAAKSGTKKSAGKKSSSKKSGGKKSAAKKSSTRRRS